MGKPKQMQPVYLLETGKRLLFSCESGEGEAKLEETPNQYQIDYVYDGRWGQDRERLGLEIGKGAG